MRARGCAFSTMQIIIIYAFSVHSSVISFTHPIHTHWGGDKVLHGRHMDSWKLFPAVLCSWGPLVSCSMKERSVYLASSVSFSSKVQYASGRWRRQHYIVRDWSRGKHVTIENEAEYRDRGKYHIGP